MTKVYGRVVRLFIFSISAVEFVCSNETLLWNKWNIVSIKAFLYQTKPNCSYSYLLYDFISNLPFTVKKSEMSYASRCVKIESKLRNRSTRAVATKTHMNFVSSTSLHGLKNIPEILNDLNKTSARANLSKRLINFSLHDAYFSWQFY